MEEEGKGEKEGEGTIGRMVEGVGLAAGYQIPVRNKVYYCAKYIQNLKNITELGTQKRNRAS